MPPESEIVVTDSGHTGEQPGRSALKTTYGKATPTERLDRARVSDLRLVGELCQIILNDHLDEPDGRQFRHLIAHCKKIGVINDKTLATIGRVKQPTANRWINGLNLPPAASRETILAKLLTVVAQRAANIERGVAEDANLDI